MKFLKVTTFYPGFQAFAESQIPGLAQLSYDEQLRHYFSFDFGWSDYWKRHIESESGMDAVELVTNLAAAQRRWAAEQSVRFSEENWESDILDAQIAFHKPDIVFFEDYLAPPAYYRAKFPFIKFIISWDGLALKNEMRFAGADLIASCHEGTVDYYRSKGIPAYHFVFGFETSISYKLKKRPATYGISFVGSINMYRNGHRNRLRLLHALDRQLKLDCWISGAERTPLLSVRMIKHAVRGLVPDALKLNTLLSHNRGQAFGIEMYQILADSKITFNNHIDAAGAYAANIRLFEATGVGTCLLTDWKPNLHTLFDLDREVVAYKTLDECVEKATWLLANEKERQAIAEAGQQRILRDYSLKKRITDFMHHIRRTGW
jgi:spore maturation protein CgeB